MQNINKEINKQEDMIETNKKVMEEINKNMDKTGQELKENIQKNKL